MNSIKKQWARAVEAVKYMGESKQDRRVRQAVEQRRIALLRRIDQIQIRLAESRDVDGLNKFADDLQEAKIAVREAVRVQDPAAFGKARDRLCGITARYWAYEYRIYRDTTELMATRKQLKTIEETGAL